MDTDRRFFLTLTVKNEAPNLLEWVAYHRLIGFTDIVVYQNDSIDQSEKLLRTMMKAGFIQYFKNQSARGGWQNKAYRRASRLDEFQNADWAMALDADEFLVVRVGDGKITDLVDALPPSTHCATIHWKIFGSSFHIEMPSGLVSEDFVLAEPADRIASRMAGFKSLFRPNAFRRIGIHKPKDPYSTEALQYCNGSGLILDKYEKLGWRSKDPGMRELAQVNHYALRDIQRFMVKSDRGRTSNHDRDVGVQYWKDFDFNLAEDSHLAQWGPKVRDEMARMDATTKGRLSELTERGRKIQQQRYAELMQIPKYRDMRDGIVETFPARSQPA